TDNSQREFQQVVRRYSREKKELQAHIQTLKNSITKNDSDRRKQLLLHIARLEAKMEQRHQRELEGFEDELNPSLESITTNLMKMNLENLSPPRSVKAMKRRERRAREEEDKISAILGPKKLEMKAIPADGHCMYRAIQDQLVYSVTVQSLRCHTAQYMREHIDDFLPFFVEPEAGNFTHEDFLRYCDDIVHRASWGGQLELRALSHVLETPIEVVQANLTIIIIEEYKKKLLILVYLHYACKFGKHYNSVKPIEASGAVGGKAPRLF
uniref:ubiquitinyl hydrolase 1 n=1 Tax=Nannospalax galili TaxID=1026970 RepID=A0A8C6RC22_NANGA